MKLYPICGFLVFLMPTGLWAQNVELSGTVTDSTKALVPGATMTLTRTNTDRSIETSTTYSTVSNSDGTYLLRAVVPGQYQFQVRKDGFRTFVRNNLELRVGDRLQLSLELQVGDATETITVTDTPELLQTTNASVSTVVDRAAVENTPLNGRSFQSLLGLAPGLTLTNPNAGVTAGVAQGQFVVNGQRADANYFTVDGVSANTGAGGPGSGVGEGGTGSLPGTTALGGFNGLASVDTIQEIRVSTSSVAPENGRTTGGQVSIVTRSGTNVFHGSISDYFRNTILDANDWFLNSTGQPRGKVRQNSFGGVLGGPIVKNKLFFFASYEGLRLTNPQPATIPTFTQDARFLAKNAVNSTNPAYTGYMYQILNAYPLPNRDLSKGDGSTCMPAAGAQLGPNCVADFVGAFPSTGRLDSGSGRIDYAVNKRLTLFGRYSNAPSSLFAHSSAADISGNYFNTGGIGGTGNALGSESTTVGIADAISPTLNHELRFNYTRSTLRQTQRSPEGFSGTLSSLFPAGFAQPPAGYSLSNMSLSFQFLSLVPSLNLGEGSSNNEQRQFNVVDTLSKTWGSHAMKFGADIRLMYPNISSPPYTFSANFWSPQGAPSCSSARPTPGSPPAAAPPGFVCGISGNTSVTTGSGDYRFQNWSFFLQDTWKVTSRLVLTYGARYEINPAPASTNGKPYFSLKNWDPVQCTSETSSSASSGTSLCDVGINPLGTSPYPTRWGNISPRIGLAYQVFKDAKWENRGVTDMFIACVDGLKGFPESIATMFPEAQVQLCIVHQVRASLNYVSWKQRKAVAADLQPIYRAGTVEEAKQRLEFAAKWDQAYPTISQMWRRNWEHLTPFFAYPADIRKVIYTTNAVESLNMSLRKVIKTRGSFPNQEAAMKLLYLALEHIAKKWTMPVQNWKAALQRFAILLGDRVPKAELA